MVTRAMGSAATQVNGALAGWLPGNPHQREDLIQVLDSSGSMGMLYDASILKLVAAQQAAKRTVTEKHRLDARDGIGVVSFSDDAQVHHPLTPTQSHRDSILEAIEGITVDGGTNIEAGLKAADECFDWSRSGAVRRIALLTDGHDGGDARDTAASLKSRGVIIDCIGIGASPSDVDEQCLRAIASIVNGQVRYRFIKDSKTLVEHYTLLANKTRIA